MPSCRSFDLDVSLTPEDAALMQAQSSPATSPPPRDELEWLCPGCGYDLQGIASDRCPECGLVIDRTGPPPARIPWQQRGHLGRATAWWRTVRLATFAPSRLAAEVTRRVSYPDALRFRLLTSAIAGLLL